MTCFLFPNCDIETHNQQVEYAIKCRIIVVYLSHWFKREIKKRQLEIGKLKITSNVSKYSINNESFFKFYSKIEVRNNENVLFENYFEIPDYDSILEIGSFENEDDYARSEFNMLVSFPRYTSSIITQESLEQAISEYDFDDYFEKAYKKMDKWNMKNGLMSLIHRPFLMRLITNEPLIYTQNQKAAYTHGAYATNEQTAEEKTPSLPKEIESKNNADKNLTRSDLLDLDDVTK